MSLFNLAFVVQTQMVIIGGLVIQSATRHEEWLHYKLEIKSHFQLLEVVFSSKRHFYPAHFNKNLNLKNNDKKVKLHFIASNKY